MALTKAEEKVEKHEASQARDRAKKSAKKMQLQELMYAGAIGAAEGVAENMGVKLFTEGLGPLKIQYLQAIGGWYLLNSGKGDAREFGSALAVIGIYRTTKGLSSGFSLGDLFGGGDD